MFAIGDYVTRAGDDVHQVVELIDDMTFVVVCRVAPAAGWCDIGDRETNLMRRYERASLSYFKPAP